MPGSLRTFVVSAFLLSLQVARALDFKVTGFECDQNLYITADSLEITCDGKPRCTFGSSVATVSGTLNYKKVYNTGIIDNVGYVSADMELVTLQYQFFDKAPISLCADGLTATTDDVACPGDGSYQFSVQYNLPSAGSPNQSWLASGWNGNSVIQIFAEADETMLIGECTFSLDTFVTPATAPNFYSRTVNPPSAAATVGIVLGAMAVLGLICLYCYCCRRKSSSVVENDDYYGAAGSRASKHPDDVSAFFKRLDDETGSAPPTSIIAPSITTRSIASGESVTNSTLPQTETPASPKRKFGSRFFGALGRKKGGDASMV